VVALNLPGQYADDRNLRARQRLWRYQDPYFDVVAWVLDLAGLSPGLRVLDAGCGNGEYLRALARRPVHAAGCDLSMGMLRTAACPALLNADVAAENAAAQLAVAFDSVRCVRPASEPPVVISDAALAADYVASLASHYQDEVARPWPGVVEDVRQDVQAMIDRDGAFVTYGDLAAFVCR
jgi:SAM-dependent methyltransferase